MRGCEHLARRGELGRRALPQQRRRDRLAEAALPRHAGLAARDVRLAAIASRGPDESDARAEPGIVVQMHVVRDGEPAAQRAQRRIMAEQVVPLGMQRCLGGEQRQQPIDLARQHVAQVGELAPVGILAVRVERIGGARHVDQAGAAARTQHDRAQPLCGQRPRPRPHHPLDPARLVVGDQQHRARRRGAAGGEAQPVDAAPRRRQRVGRDVRCDLVAVAGMQALQDGEVAGHQRASRGDERDVADMPHEGLRNADMAPAQRARTQAKLVLLAVALREQVLAQRPGLVQAVATQVPAEAMAGRHLDRAAAAIGGGGEGHQPPGLGEVRHRIGVAVLGIAEDAGVVGERGWRCRCRATRRPPRAARPPTRRRPACRC